MFKCIGMPRIRLERMPGTRHACVAALRRRALLVLAGGPVPILAAAFRQRCLAHRSSIQLGNAGLLKLRHPARRAGAPSPAKSWVKRNEAGERRSREAGDWRPRVIASRGTRVNPWEPTSCLGVQLSPANQPFARTANLESEGRLLARAIDHRVSVVGRLH